MSTAINSVFKSLAAISLVHTITLMAGSAPIGLVQASGQFRLNQATIHGQSTLFDGAVLETAGIRSDVTLASGGHLALAPNSKTRLFRTYAVLESGAADFSASGYTLKAASLSISGSGAQVVMDSPAKIRVGALSSPIEVRNASDLLIARVYPGRPLEFENAGQGGASGRVTITGTLKKNADIYTVTDSTTNITYQVQGKDLDKKVGKKVRIVGSLVAGATAGAVPVIAATTVVATAAVAGGLSAVAIAGIVIGGATATGLGVASAEGAFSSTSAQ